MLLFCNLLLHPSSASPGEIQLEANLRGSTAFSAHKVGVAAKIKNVKAFNIYIHVSLNRTVEEDRLRCVKHLLILTDLDVKEFLVQFGNFGALRTVT